MIKSKLSFKISKTKKEEKPTMSPITYITLSNTIVRYKVLEALENKPFLTVHEI